MRGKGNSHIDALRLNERFGARLPVSEVAKIYLEEMPPVLEKLARYGQSDLDFQNMEATAHGVKGSFSMIGADKVVASASQLEKAASGHQEYLTRRLCERLTQTLCEVKAELRVLVDEDSALG